MDREELESKGIRVFGKQLLFFVWNALVLALEPLVKDKPFFQFICKRLPGPLQTALVILTVLPLGHLFTDVYVDTGFYSSFAIGFPRIVKITSDTTS
jgi:hypothetical protein